MKIYDHIKTLCNYCGKELEKDYISLDCNETGITNDEYTIDFCDITCLRNEKEKDGKDYTQEELDSMSSYYQMEKYLEKK